MIQPTRDSFFELGRDYDIHLGKFITWMVQVRTFLGKREIPSLVFREETTSTLKVSYLGHLFLMRHQYFWDAPKGRRSKIVCYHLSPTDETTLKMHSEYFLDEDGYVLINETEKLLVGSHAEDILYQLLVGNRSATFA